MGTNSSMGVQRVNLERACVVGRKEGNEIAFPQIFPNHESGEPTDAGSAAGSHSECLGTRGKELVLHLDQFGFATACKSPLVPGSWR